MQELLQKIKANAAVRLRLPPGRRATEELARYKAYLKVESHRLKMQHRAGGSGMEVCQARAAMLDLLLMHFWAAAMEHLPDPKGKRPVMALVAIGGYGRGELNPYSDIDFMFLHSGNRGGAQPSPQVAAMVDALLYPLWDLGLKVGHSVRTLSEAIEVANTDMQSRTSLIEARLIAGDDALFNKFEKTLLSKCVTGKEEAYIAQRLNDQAARRAKFGNSACMQEPNIKNGCGGLRDFQNLLWMAFFKYRTRSLQELQGHGLLTEPERKQLEQAYDYLLRVRTELHYHVNRPMDVLTKNLQPAVAYSLGFHERSPSRRIEGFMRKVYTHSRHIYLITRTLEQRMALLPEPPASGLILRKLLPRGTAKPVEPVDGFKFQGGEIRAVSNRVFTDQPRRLMRVFLYAQERGVRLHPDLAQLIRNQLGLVDRAFMSDAHVRDTFLTILSHRGSVARILRVMHDVDLLGKYIPEFGILTCMVQHEFYHQYTADEHTLMCLEQLDRIWEAREDAQNRYAQLFQSVEQPALLYLALLLHDVGRPEGKGKHSQLSSAMALKTAKRLALDPASTQTLRLIIENHMLMASVSQRQDLDDPSVIRNFARQIQTPENLNLLTLHTYADSQATSDKLWNGFKDSLLWTLHMRTVELFTGGSEFARVEEKHREQLLLETRKLLPGHFSDEEVQAHFTNLPARYYQIHKARQVAQDIVLAHDFMRKLVTDQGDGLAPAVNWQNEPDCAYSAVKICTWDRAGLFWKISGSFSAAGLNILSAQVFTRTDGIVLDTFFVNDARSGALANEEQRVKFESILCKALAGEELDFAALIARQKITRPAYQAYLGERLPTRVRFDNESSDSRTLIEVESEDRVGLLYSISRALAEMSLDLSSAKISTERGAVIDSFYVGQPGGGKVLSTEAHHAIEAKLQKALASPGQTH